MYHNHTLQTSPNTDISIKPNLGRRFGASKMHLSTPWWLRLLYILSGWSVVVDSMFNVPPIDCGGSVLDAVLSVLSNFAIIFSRKRELVALLVFLMFCDYYCLWFFFTVTRVGLQCVIVVFSDHTHLLF